MVQHHLADSVVVTGMAFLLKGMQAFWAIRTGCSLLAGNGPDLFVYFKILMVPSPPLFLRR